jgi:hypothetical protein
MHQYPHNQKSFKAQQLVGSVDNRKLDREEIADLFFLLCLLDLLLQDLVNEDDSIVGLECSAIRNFPNDLLHPIEQQLVLV